MVILTAAGTFNHIPDFFFNNVNPIAAFSAFSDKIHTIKTVLIITDPRMKIKRSEKDAFLSELYGFGFIIFVIELG